MTTINDTNYEVFLLHYAEGQLSDIERAEVEAWLADHPEAAEELALYSEAPRLECDESVRYTRLLPLAPQGRRPQFTSHLSPFLRWSTAAAILVAFMLPAFRMGTMGQLEPQEPQLVAATTTPSDLSTPNIPGTPKKTIKPIDTIRTIDIIETIVPEEPLLIAQEENTLPLLPQEEPSVVPTAIPSESLIVYVPAPDTIYTNTLIVYDNSRPLLRDIAAEWVEDTPVAKFIRHNLSPRKAVMIASR